MDIKADEWLSCVLIFKTSKPLPRKIT